MFDLNQQVTKWRTNLAQSEACSKSDIDELESHLREEIEHLSTCELSEQEAFLVAAHRLGDSGSLTGEFAKVNRGRVFRRRLLWIALGVLSYILATYFAAAFSKGSVLFAASLGLRGCFLAFVGVASNIAVFCAAMLLLCLLFRLAGSGPGLILKSALAKLIFILAFIVAGIILIVAQILLPSLTVRILSASEYGRMAMFSAYAFAAWHVVLPVILFILLFILRDSNLRAARQ